MIKDRNLISDNAGCYNIRFIGSTELILPLHSKIYIIIHKTLR
jgi:hypothetical protein